MCMWVGSPESRLKYVYCSECIVPQPDGGLRVVVDLLLENIGDNAVERLFLIYPHAFPLVEDDWEGDWRINGGITDASLSLRSQDDPDNRIYLTSGEVVPLSPAQDQAHPRLRMSLPDVNFTERVVDYEGTLACNETVAPGWDGLAESHWRVLDSLDFSLWSCALEITIGPGERRWFRWVVQSMPSRFNRSGRWSKWLRWGTIRYDYTILGPVNVRDNLYSRLNTLRRHAPESDTVTAATQLVEMLETLHLREDAWVPEVRDWRINLSPGLIPRVENLTQQNILVAGHQPNILNYEGLRATCGSVPARERLYQWKTGADHLPQDVPDDPGNYRFSIYFDWVNPSPWPLLATILSLLVGSVALGLSIYSLWTATPPG